MSRFLIAILLAIAALFVLSIVADNRIAAGGGALLLLGALIIYGYVHNKGASAATTAKAERGAARLREELEEEAERRED